MNPITGRRYVKSWMFDDLLKEAEQFYSNLETLLDCKVFHRIPIVRSLFNHQEEQDWWIRRQDQDYTPYMHPPMNNDACTLNLLRIGSYTIYMWIIQHYNE